MGIGGWFALAVAAVWSGALVLIDVRFHRLPDPLTLPACAVAAAACVAYPAATWGLVWPATYLLIGRGIGGGDVKLAVPLGVAAAIAAGPAGVFGAMALAGALSVVAGLALQVPRVPHGPAMLTGTWALVVCGV